MIFFLISGQDFVSLVDVCNNPKSRPDRQPEVSSCNVQSLWGYWQDNITLFDQEHIHDVITKPLTWQDHFFMCTSNPTALTNPDEIQCMSAGGLPMFPFVVLGGFLPKGKRKKNIFGPKIQNMILFFKLPPNSNIFWCSEKKSRKLKNKKINYRKN